MSDHPEIRIGDRERLRTQDRLRDAYGQGALSTEELEERLELALRARTQSDLVPLVADLPAPRDEGLDPLSRPAVVEAQEAEASRGHHVPWGWIIVWVLIAGGFGVGDRILGGLTNADAITVFGSRQLTLSEGDPEVSVLTIFGSLEITVPEEVVAANNTTPIFGSAECASACTTTGDQGQTTVTVTGLTLFGSVEFHR